MHDWDDLLVHSDSSSHLTALGELYEGMSAATECRECAVAWAALATRVYQRAITLALRGEDAPSRV